MSAFANKSSFEEISEILSQGPELYILSRPQLDSVGFSEFLKEEMTSWRRTPQATDAENLVEFAGRICYMSFGELQSPKTNEQYIQHLIFQGHESVLEHASWSFLLKGVSRAFSHQMVRHRIGFSFSQLSQQYHDESDAKFVVPEEIKSSPKAMELWLQLIEEIRDGYQSMANRLQSEGDGQLPPKEARRALRSAARSVLPNATETKMVFSANARSIRHFLTMRGAIMGDLEMRIVSDRLYALMMAEAPVLLSDFERVIPADGYPIIKRKENKKATF